MPRQSSDESAHSHSHVQTAFSSVFGTMEGMSESLDPLRRTFDTAADLGPSPGPTRPGHVLHLLSVGGSRGARTAPPEAGPLAGRSTLRRLVGRILPAMVDQ
jgi:hypothetical protein